MKSINCTKWSFEIQKDIGSVVIFTDEKGSRGVCELNCNYEIYGMQTIIDIARYIVAIHNIFLKSFGKHRIYLRRKS